MVSLAKLLNAQIKADVLAAQKTGELAKIAALNSPAATKPATTTTTKTVATTTPATQTVTPTVSYDDMVKAAYGSIGRTGMGTASNQIDTEGYNYWLNALKSGQITPDQFNAKFNEAVTVANTKAPLSVTDYEGKTYDGNVILSLARQLAPTLDANNLKGGVYGTKGESIGFNYDEATKLLGHAPTAAEQVVLDMARQLNQTGITDLSQVEASDTSNRFGATYTGGGGTIYEIKKDPNTGAITTSTWGKSTSDKGNIVAALSVGAGLLGIPTQLGTAILGTGANTLAAGALGGGLFGGGAAALTGGDVLKGALLGAAGGAGGEYLKTLSGGTPTTTIDTSSPFTGADYNLANTTSPTGLESMGGAQGLQNGTSANLASMGGAQGLTFNVGAPVTTLADAINAINTMNGSYNPANLSEMGGGQGLTYQTPTGLVTQGGTLLVGGNTGNNSVIGETGIDTAYNIGSGIGDALTKLNTGVQDLNTSVVPTTTVTPIVPTTPITPADIIKTISTAATIATIPTLINKGTTPTPTGGYDIVPIPTNWTTPPKPTVAPFTPLPAINFGNRNMLVGTQWEKFLDPNYGKVPAPVQYSQPSNLSYNDLMGILGSKQGMPAASNLSINDIISGIQNQYGQTPEGSMG